LRHKRLLKDELASKFMLILTIFSSMIVFLMAFGLYQRSRSILATKSLTELLFSTSWHPFLAVSQPVTVSWPVVLSWR